MLQVLLCFELGEVEAKTGRLESACRRSEFGNIEGRRCGLDDVFDSACGLAMVIWAKRCNLLVHESLDEQRVVCRVEGKNHVAG